MTFFEIQRKELRTGDLLEMRHQLDLAPEYQREGAIWTLERQQLFIDSIINGYDVPPIYLHALRPPRLREGRTYSYAVIDGKQRLEALWSFHDGQYGLAEDFVFLPELPHATADDRLDDNVKHEFGGSRFGDLFFASSSLHYRFLDYEIPVVVVETQEIEVIEELFFRLNEGVPLTAAEKRNRGQVLRDVVVPLVEEEGLLDIVKFRRKRRNYADIVLRLLFLEHQGFSSETVPDFKKRSLDAFAERFRPRAGGWGPGEEGRAKRELAALVDRVRPVLTALADTFEESDPLLRRITDYISYYLAFRWLIDANHPVPPRQAWLELHDAVARLQGESEERMDDQDFRLLELARPIQGATTGSYYRERAMVLYDFATGALTVS